MSKDTSQSAFPWQLLTEPGEPSDPVTGAKHGPNERSRHLQAGMSLRDYFAASALQGFIACHAGVDIATPTADYASARAYEYADAMLKERAK